MKTKKAAALLLIIIILCFIPSVFAMNFSDIPDDFWAYTEIEDLTSTGIINGYPDGTYKPHGTIKRGEFLKLALITCFPEEESFGDEVKEGEHWAKHYLDYAQKYNLVDDTWTTESLDTLITRLEMCRLVAYAEVKAIKIPLDKNRKTLDFSDVDTLNDTDSILLAYDVDQKIIYGYEDGTFKPYKNMTRAETACIIYRLKAEVKDYVDYSKLTKPSGGSSVTKYTITYDANGGEGAPQAEKKTKNKDYVISAVIPTRDEYEFLGWNIVKDTQDVMYVGGDIYDKNANLKLYAVWHKDEEGPEDPAMYLIQFVDEDGTLLQSGEVESGDMPEYLGELPTKSGDAEFTYEFDKWTPDIVVATEDATYTATYTQTKNRYVITFVDEDNSFIASGDYEYGTEASDIVLPADPTKSGDAEWSYTFNKWTPDIVVATEDATYTASYTQTKNRYEIRFEDEDGTLLLSGDYEYGTPSGDIVTPREPTKSGDAEWSYTFDKWTPDIVNVIGNAIYTASYTRAPINAQYVSGDRFNAMIKELATGIASTVDTKNTNITSIKIQSAKPSDEILTSDDTINVGIEAENLNPIYAWFDNGTIKLWSEAQNIKMNDDASYMFKDLNKLATLNPTEDLGVDSTINVTDMSHMFELCNVVSTLDITGLNTSNVTNMNAMFKECQAVTSLAVTSTIFDTSNVEDMGGMFYDCRALTSLDLSEFNTSKVSEMKAMFFNCASMTNINLTGFNTSLVSDFTGLFGMCMSLSTIDISSFDTSNVTKMDMMFYYCEKLSNIIGIKDLNTSSLQTTGSMFFRCIALQTLDLSGWDTTNLVSCNGGGRTLAAAGYPEHYNGMFEECSNLTRIDLTGWSTPNLTNTSYMFAKCHNLQRIYASPSFVVTNVTSDENMFKSDTAQHPSPKLTGGNGTSYDVSHIDKEYAWIDGRDATPGYFWWHSSYTIEFNGNGATSGDMESVQADYGVMKRLPANTFEWYGKEFVNWNTEANGSGDRYNDKARVKNLTLVSGDTVTLYAQWKDITYTITFENEDGTVLQSGDVGLGVMPVYSGDTPTKSGDAEWSYTFDKWVPDIVPASGDAIYTASYIQTKNRYEIRFEDEDGTLLLSGDYEYGTLANDIVKPADPTKSGDAEWSYTFDKWTPDITNVSGDATYTASYNRTAIASNQYLIKFVDGDTLLQSVMVDEGETPRYSGEIPTRPIDEYDNRLVFEGWYPDIVPATRNATYHAYYYSVYYDGEYAIFYYPNASGDFVADMPMEDIKYEGCDYYILDFIPERLGYKFSHWEAYSGDEVIIYNPGDVYTEDADLRLYAKWTYRGFGPYTITYHENAGGDLVENMPEPQQKIFDEVTVLSDQIPTREGYVFMGWSEESDSSFVNWDPGMEYWYEDDLDLYAVWRDPRIQANLKVGDYVTYQPAPATYELTYEKTGYDYIGNNKDTILSTEQASERASYWRVYNISGDTIQIIPNKSFFDSKVYLQGTIAASIGDRTVDEICSTLYTDSDLAQEVRSLRYDDIRPKITQMNNPSGKWAYFLNGDLTPLEDSAYTKKYHSSDLINGYDEPRFYVWSSDEGEKIKYDPTQLKVDENGVEYMTPIDGHPVYVEQTQVAGYKIHGWQTISIAESNTSPGDYGKILQGSKSAAQQSVAWLSSKHALLHDGSVGTCLTVFYFVTDSTHYKSFGEGELASSRGDINDYNNAGIRPIVTLRTDLRVVGGTGASPTSAWVLEPKEP